MWDFHPFLINVDPNMKRKRYSEEQIISILKQHEAGRTMVELARENGIAENTLYRWKSKYGGMEASDLRRVKELEAENAQLKRLYAELALDNAAMKDLIAKKLWGRRSGARLCGISSRHTSAR